MGSCLSKGGEKAPKDDDKTPYAPSKGSMGKKKGGTINDRPNEELPPADVRGNTYDVPPRRDKPKPVSVRGSDGEVYDTPTYPAKPVSQIYDTPRSPAGVNEEKPKFVKDHQYETVRVKDGAPQMKPTQDPEAEPPSKPPRLKATTEVTAPRPIPPERAAPRPTPPERAAAKPTPTEDKASAPPIKVSDINLTTKKSSPPPRPRSPVSRTHVSESQVVKTERVALNTQSTVIKTERVVTNVESLSTKTGNVVTQQSTESNVRVEMKESSPPPRPVFNAKPVSTVQPLTTPQSKTLPAAHMSSFGQRDATPYRPGMGIIVSKDQAPVEEPPKVNLEDEVDKGAKVATPPSPLNITPDTPDRAPIPSPRHIRNAKKATEIVKEIEDKEDEDKSEPVIELHIDEGGDKEESPLKINTNGPATGPVENGTKTPTVVNGRRGSSPTSRIAKTPDRDTTPLRQQRTPSMDKDFENDRWDRSSSSSAASSPTKQSRIPSLTPMDARPVLETPTKADSQDDDSSVTSSVEIFPDSEDEDDLPEPPTVRLPTTFKSLMAAYSAENLRIHSRIQVVLNTRTKIMNCIEKWFLGDKPDSRVMVISGVPGVGKTHLASAICEKHRNNLAGSHFFQYNSPSLGHNTAKALVITMAHSLSEVFPNYMDVLPSVQKIEQAVEECELGELFDCLIKDPLFHEELQHDATHRLLFVVDGLDQCEFDDRNLLSQIVCHFNEVTPHWLHLLVTCRNDNQLLGSLENVKTMELKSTLADNQVDLKRSLKEPLSNFMDRISLDGGLTQLAKKTEGLFLCAHFLGKFTENFPEDKKVALREIETLYPTGLSNIYQAAFGKFKNALEKVNYKRVTTHELYNTILSVLIAAREPLHADFLFALFSANAKNPIMAALEEIGDFIVQDKEERLSFYHQHIIEWLTNEEQEDDNSSCAVNPATGRDRMAEMCLKWLGDIVSDTGVNDISEHLRHYAFKHAIYHLLDVPKQQENIGNILCNLSYVQNKLLVPGVTVHHLKHDYVHEHYQAFKEKSIKLEDYFKRAPKLFEQITYHRQFLLEMEKHIKASPEHTLQVAANYTRKERIKQNARLELEEKPWLEALTAMPETPCFIRKPGGGIKALDVSADGKTVAVVTKDGDHKMNLCLYDAHTGDLKAPPQDIKNLKDRYGLVVKFMADGQNAFVGSFSTYVSSQGKLVPSHLDMQTIQMAEKYTIECCDMSARFLACGLTTIPWSGRSLHICLFDLKSKKCIATIEVLRFRFGGSASFGIRSIAVSRTKPFMCAAVKLDNKPQLRVLVYSTTKFNVHNSTDIQNENFTNCMVIDEEAAIVGSGLRPLPTAGKARPDMTLLQSEVWQFKDVSNKTLTAWDAKESHSVFANVDEGAACARWSKASGHATLNIWDSTNPFSNPSARYIIRGLSEMAFMRCTQQTVAFSQGEEVYIYDVQNMEPMGDVSEPQGLSEIKAENTHFLARSNTVLISSESMDDDDVFTVTECDIRSEESIPSVSGFSKEPRHKGEYPKYRTYFNHNGTINDVCFSNYDGSCVLFNSGDHLKVYDRNTTAKKSLPEFADLNERATNRRRRISLRAAASPKENIVAVVFAESPAVIFLFDIKTGKKLKKFVRGGRAAKVAVTDFAFMPSNGFLLSYHRDAQSLLCTWSPRLGELLSTDNLKISYAKVSPASDRVAISIRTINRRVGEIILRNSDAKFSNAMILPDDAVWRPGREESDVEFSPDGTALIGVCSETNICRIWNAANGEILNDLDLTFGSSAAVVGMLTNTHAIFHDDSLVVVDIATGEVITRAPLGDRLRSTRRNDIKVSPRGTSIVAIKESKRLAVFYCHNFATIKRKTTLQRMKSIKNY